LEVREEIASKLQHRPGCCSVQPTAKLQEPSSGLRKKDEGCGDSRPKTCINPILMMLHPCSAMPKATGLMKMQQQITQAQGHHLHRCCLLPVTPWVGKVDIQISKEERFNPLWQVSHCLNEGLNSIKIKWRNASFNNSQMACC